VHRAAVSDEGWGFVVSRLSVSYLKPAKLDDEIMATAITQRVGGATVEFTQRIHRGDNVLLTADVQIACVDQMTGRPRRLQCDIKERLLAAMTTERDQV
jgi:YbgC/YbaW family acyl-CoA thioester hydrolase